MNALKLHKMPKEHNLTHNHPWIFINKSSSSLKACHENYININCALIF